MNGSSSRGAALSACALSQLTLVVRLHVDVGPQPRIDERRIDVAHIIDLVSQQSVEETRLVQRGRHVREEAVVNQAVRVRE